MNERYTLTIQRSDARRISDETGGAFLVPPGDLRRDRNEVDEFVDFEVPEKHSCSRIEAQNFARQFAQAHNLSYCSVIVEPALTQVVVFPVIPDGI